MHRAAKAGTGFGDVNSLLLGEFLVAVLALWPRLHSFVMEGLQQWKEAAANEWVWVEEGNKIESLEEKQARVSLQHLDVYQDVYKYTCVNRKSLLFNWIFYFQF